MDEILDEAATILDDALRTCQALHSEHEGLGMIREKYKDLENEIFGPDRFGAKARMRTSALELAVAALRMALFIDDNPRTPKNGVLLFQSPGNSAGGNA